MIFKRVTAGWAKLRLLAWERSKGKCERCGFDIAAMVSDLTTYSQKADQTTTRRYSKIMYGKKARNWPLACWAVDHIAPVSEGGDSLPPLEGVRVLDIECHDLVTAELRKRLSERRKNHRWMPFVL